MRHAVDVIDRPEDCAAPTKRARGSASGTRLLDYVARSAPIFQPGQQRRLYRVEEGAVCHFGQWGGARFEFIECAFPGDIIGLGYLPTHTTLATAMVDTMLSSVSPDEFEQALRDDDQLAFRLADAGEREFEYLRGKSMNAGISPPVQRVANYLLAISGINSRDGRDRHLIMDDISSGVVAEQLQMTIDTLSMSMLSLRRSGLLDVTSHGLHVVDISGLEAVASGDGLPVLPSHGITRATTTVDGG